jgi:four helix bundle protein
MHMRRAAVSVASNIAEGAARKSSKEFANFLGVALGSLAELDTQIELASSLGWLAAADGLIEQHRRAGQLTTRLRQAIGRRNTTGSRITDHGSR